MGKSKFKSFRQACFLVFLLTLLVVNLAGCGASRVNIDPEFGNEYFQDPELKRSDIVVVQVMDDRNSDSQTLGTGKTGFFNKTVPVVSTLPIRDFVDRALAEILGTEAASQPYRPIAVRVDTLHVFQRAGFFSEIAVCQASLVFVYLKPDGQIGEVRSRAEVEKSASDATGKLEETTYACVALCTRYFLQEVADLGQVGGEEELAAFSETAAKKLSNSETTNLPAVGGMASDFRVKRRAIDLAYLQGDKIESGNEVLYRQSNYQRGGSWELSYGIGARFFDVLNQEAMVEGSFSGLVLALSCTWHISKNLTGPYLRLCVQPTWGGETIDGSDVNYFFGAIATQSIGMVLTPNFALELGVYGMTLSDSIMLPDDFGWRGGMAINF